MRRHPVHSHPGRPNELRRERASVAYIGELAALAISLAPWASEWVCECIITTYLTQGILVGSRPGSALKVHIAHCD